MRSPLDHGAMNVAVHGPKFRRWALCERPIAPADRSADRLFLGASSIAWRGDDLVIDVDEPTAPVPGRVRGRVVVSGARAQHRRELDPKGEHLWFPVIPHGRATVELDSPRLRFTGSAYHDANWGSVPLEDTFDSWTWSRTPVGDRTVVDYDVVLRGGERVGASISINRSGVVRSESPAPWSTLPRTFWRIDREARGADARVVRDLEDTPFYSRSLVARSTSEGMAVGMHESLSLHRVRSRLVERLLGWRMSRSPVRRDREA